LEFIIFLETVVTESAVSNVALLNAAALH